MTLLVVLGLTLVVLTVLSRVVDIITWVTAGQREASTTTVTVHWSGPLGTCDVVKLVKGVRLVRG